MTRSLALREIRLLMIMPAVLIVAIYVYAFERPQREQLVALRHAVDQAQSQAPQNPAPHAPTATARWTTPAGRLSALSDISTVFDSHNVFVQTTTHLPDTALTRVASPALQDFAAALKHQPHLQAPQIWQIDVVGSYRDVLAALDQIGRSHTFIVPLGISMEPIDDETTYRHWSLWIWV